MDESIGDDGQGSLVDDLFADNACLTPCDASLRFSAGGRRHYAFMAAIHRRATRAVAPRA